MVLGILGATKLFMFSFSRGITQFTDAKASGFIKWVLTFNVSEYTLTLIERNAP